MERETGNPIEKSIIIEEAIAKMEWESGIYIPPISYPQKYNPKSEAILESYPQLKE